jgi:RNA binding exosome subunit
MEIRVFSHATEDLKKVEAAVRNTLPEALAEEAVFNKTNCVGHHGNPIVTVETKLSNRELLVSALQKLGASLSTLDKEQLDAEMKSHIDKHNLFLRLDKQNASLGTVKLSATDPIHFKIHFKNRATDEIMELCRQAGLLP